MTSVDSSSFDFRVVFIQKLPSKAKELSLLICRRVMDECHPQGLECESEQQRLELGSLISLSAVNITLTSHSITRTKKETRLDFDNVGGLSARMQVE